MHLAVLADFQLGQVEAERLRLPDQVLQLAIGEACRTCLRQRIAERMQVA